MTADYLTPDDVASQLQVSRQVVYNWINDGRLRAVKAGRNVRIPHAALEAFLQPVPAGDFSANGIEPERFLGRDRFTASAQAVMEAARNEVLTRRNLQAEVEHTLWALMQPADGIGQQALRQMGIDPQLVILPLEQALAKLPTDPNMTDPRPMVGLAANVAPLLERVEQLASEVPDLQIDTTHILLAICEQTDSVSAQILHSVGVTPERLRLVLMDIYAARRAASPQAATPLGANRDERIEQQLARIETELAAIRAMLAQTVSRAAA